MENMTNLQQVLLFAFIGTGLVAGIGDYITTSIGLGKGLVEGNPVSAWMQKKVGQAGAAFIALAGFIATSLLISKFTAVGSIVFAAGITALEAYMTIRNNKLNNSIK
jgi:hypothetical protein